ncbi:MAG: rRNA maturation RNase YbeY [Deltaproteobacteria bacterium]|nr:rRNA maturation RNase YbeY [Deltaproteobacteria bacterium]
MNVELRCQHPSGPALARRVRARARLLLAELGRPQASLSILLTTDGRIRTLNRRWRSVDHATDVLSFPAHRPPGGGPELGDLAISLDTARRRASRAGRSLGDEVDRYLVHGLLHLVGHDHLRPADARAMARVEDELLGLAGMVTAALGRRAVAR